MTAPVFILAGEPSGDQLAASIMDAVEGRFGKQNWFGIGGPLMQERGLASEAEMAQLSVMGFGAALSAYPRLSALANRLVQRIIEARPRAVITYTMHLCRAFGVGTLHSSGLLYRETESCGTARWPRTRSLEESQAHSRSRRTVADGLC